MSGLSGNPYTDVHIGATPESVATLALAYEQRTANLIAFEAGHWAAFQADPLNAGGIELWRKSADQIAERLGLA